MIGEDAGYEPRPEDSVCLGGIVGGIFTATEGAAIAELQSAGRRRNMLRA